MGRDGEVPIDTRDIGLPVIGWFFVLKGNPFVRVRFHLPARVTD